MNKKIVNLDKQNFFSVHQWGKVPSSLPVDALSLDCAPCVKAALAFSFSVPFLRFVQTLPKCRYTRDHLASLLKIHPAFDTENAVVLKKIKCMHIAVSLITGSLTLLSAHLPGI